MRDVVLLLVHLLATLAKLLGPGGTRAVVVESLLLKHQLLISNRSRQRAPNLRPLDRVVLGLMTLVIAPSRLRKLAVACKPATLLRFHTALVKRKYRLLFSSTPNRHKPGPKGPPADLIAAVVAIKRANPHFGYLRIAQQIAAGFNIDIDKDTVRRVLARHYRPESGGGGPSWLSFIGHAKDSLWSIDLFRCESIHLRSHWVLVVIDVCTRRLIGFGVEAGDLDGVAVCRMFNRATRASASYKYQQRSRPAVSLSPVASQPARARRNRNQIDSLCAHITPVYRAADRNDSP